MKGLVASVYLDRDPTPVIEVHDLTLGSVGGTVGFWSRNGGGYLSNVRYRPDTTTYPLTLTHHFAPGAITDGWAISDEFPVTQADPDVYPKVATLKWEPVKAEREGIVLIARYRKDPRVEGPRRLLDCELHRCDPSPGTAVRCPSRRTTITT